jgi:phosphatidylserine/phosphatidylglycerophosphate/cardiolipin synthase-like enzyme
VRAVERGSLISARVVSGTNSVLFGLDVDEGKRDGFLGFALHRTDLETERSEWLPNFLRFEVNDHPGGSVLSRDNPVQAFQWADYTVAAGQNLRYRVQALYGKPEQLDSRDEIEIEISTEAHDDGNHGIYFNRGIAASQAYARDFGNVSPLISEPARRWLSRGLEEALLDFIGRAKGPGWGLHGALYEFRHPRVLEALLKAAVDGVKVDLAVSSPSADGFPTYPAAENAGAMTAVRIKGAAKTLASCTSGRQHSGDIAHNKFLILLEDEKPVAVWTGSTNITEGAIYGHSNVGHIVYDEAIAAKFLRYWQLLREDPEPDELRQAVEAETPLPDGPPKENSLTAVFSPRLSSAAAQNAGRKYTLDWYVDRMREAKQASFLTAAFGVSEPFDALLQVEVPEPRYILLDRIGEDDSYLQSADFSGQVTAGAYLGKGAWNQFLTEQLSGLNTHALYIHTKYMLIDPMTDDPLLVSGSANFSDNSTSSNDENMLVIRGDQRAADIYLTEFMRIFTHLRFRAATVGDSTADPAPDPLEPGIEPKTDKHLNETSDWTSDYFDPGTPKFKERELFRAPPP